MIKYSERALYKYARLNEKDFRAIINGYRVKSQTRFYRESINLAHR